MIAGRTAELAAIGAWLIAGTAGGHDARPAMLSVEGQAGIGKTTLWSAAVEAAARAGWRVLSCRPAPSDAALAYVGLTDLLSSVPDERLGDLPEPQRRPLAIALLREPAAAELDFRAVSTGLTGLLTVAADMGPLLLAIDDAQWLDQASGKALAFALHRIEGRPLRIIISVRVDGATRPRVIAGIEAALRGPDERARIAVGPLSVAALHEVFTARLGSSFPRPMLTRIHAVASGNPFYALEIAREISRVGAPPPGHPLPVPDDHRELALLRVRRLPRATRQALEMMAAMPRPAVTLLDMPALAVAEHAGIVRVRRDGVAEFTHPLFGSALYSSLTEIARRELHRRLAARVRGTEERARHLALAATEPDAEAADELDQAAASAGARGATDMAVEFKELACQLTPAHDTESLLRRTIELADRRYFAGDSAGARRTLEGLLAHAEPGEDRARVLLELGSVLWARGEADRGTEMMEDALRQHPSPPLRAQIHSRISALADDIDVSVRHGEAALALLDMETDPQTYSFALHNVALFRLYAGLGADHDVIELGMRLQKDAAAWEMSTVPAFWARNFDDFAVARRRFEVIIAAFRDQGDQATASGALTHLAVIEAMTGHIARARELVAEALELAVQTEQETLLNMATAAEAEIHVRAGDLDAARRTAALLLGRLAGHPDIVLDERAAVVLGHAALVSGDLAEAERRLSHAYAVQEALHAREPAGDRFQSDYAETVICLGDLTRAEKLVSWLEQRAAALPRPWIDAVSARNRGLLNAAKGDLAAAEADFSRALAAHQRLDMPAELGRTLIATGRLLRRKRQRRRARECFAEAVRVLAACQSAAWESVARREIDRTRGGDSGAGGEITSSERVVCELAMTGLRNAEIAARLLLSPKTVEANLSRAYRKLGIRSRTELAAALARTGPRSSADA
jgi:DNA-binding CsgD family transcriptional regulator